jgi:hypothetical protein
MHITHSGNGKLVCDARLWSFASRRSASGGARRSRTDDILLAKQALYQLSYGPFSGSSQESCRRTVQMDPRGLVGPGRLELPTLRLSGVRSNHLSYGPRAARQPGVPGSRSRHQLHDPYGRGVDDESGKRNGDGGILLVAQNATALRLLERSSLDRSLNSLVRGWRSILRKEVIQPQVPLRLPCYDFTPVADPTVVACLLAVSAAPSGRTNSHGVTGGVYKARERIHRGMLIRDY